MSNLRNQTLNRLNNVGLPPSCTPPVPTPLIPFSIFEDMIYEVIHENGYQGTKEEFFINFTKILEKDLNSFAFVFQGKNLSDFPEKGQENTLYIDTENDSIYYWKENYYRINEDLTIELKNLLPLSGGQMTGDIILKDGSIAISEKVLENKMAECTPLKAIRGVLLGPKGEEAPINEENKITLPIAGEALGLVKTSDKVNQIKIEIDGTMSINKLEVSKLYVAESEELILNSGGAN